MNAKDLLPDPDTAGAAGAAQQGPLRPTIASVVPAEPQRHARALEQLFAATRTELTSYFTRRLGNVEIAAEHAQDTFLRFARSGYRADGPEARAIVFGIARNLLLDVLRQRRRHQLSGFDESHRLDSASMNEIASAEATPEEAMNASQELEQALGTLQSLPPKCRQVFVLHRLHGRSHKQIAEELGITRSMVEKHIMEAAARLLRAVYERPEDP